jgi:E3 ubiquitin-protein ligase MARCH6
VSLRSEKSQTLLILQRSETVSTVPIDLIFLQFALPYTMRHLRPRKFFHQWAVRIWKILAARLRLTSYMMGDRHPEEEFTAKFDNLTAFLRRSTNDSEVASKTHDGTFRRVPATDNIALPKDMRATAEVLPDGTPANPAAEALMEAQNAEAVKAKRDIKNDYLVVYFPPNFRMRIFGFIASVWTVVAVLAAIFIAVPVQLGRRFFGVFTQKELHDGYSFLAGVYLLWACYLVTNAAERMDKRRQRRGGDGPRAEFAVFFIKRSFLWLSKIAYMGIFLGIIIPILLALVIDLYIVMPVRLTHNPTMDIRIRIVDMWALGLVYGKVFMRINRRPQFDVGRGVVTVGGSKLLAE